MPPEEGFVPPERDLERVTYERAKTGISEFVRHYRKRFGDHFSSDKAAELFPEYTKDRTGNRATVTKASHLVADSAIIDRVGESDKTPVTMVMGGPGAGKTTTANEAVALGRIVFDGNAVHGERLLPRLAASGRQVENIYIHRDPVEAFRGTLMRAVQAGPEQAELSR